MDMEGSWPDTWRTGSFLIRDYKGLYFRESELLYRTAAPGVSFIVLPILLIFTKCLRRT